MSGQKRKWLIRQFMNLLRYDCLCRVIVMYEVWLKYNETELVVYAVFLLQLTVHFLGW